MTRYRFQNDTEILPTEWMVADVAEDSLKMGSDVVFAVTMDHVVKVWGVAWKDEAAVIARFDREKLEYLPQMESHSLDDVDGVGYFIVGKHWRECLE
jgi:hypothetical protein